MKSSEQRFISASLLESNPNIRLLFYQSDSMNRLLGLNLLK
jgi:hypothetical protein